MVQGATTVMLGNGTVIDNLVAPALVTISSQTASGPVLLDDTTNDVLVGMALLREFKLALILTDTTVVLYNRQETLEAISSFMQTAPIGSPNTSPSSTTLRIGDANE